ncbi:hypothetical protein PP359_07140 [Sphingomonas sp. BLCC-B65]|uniref:hypothetical protein n=1 Tax=uncultured Microbacterium sp. TaxID=191216 RepID=UPI0025D77A2C|nr:hypothetical protein [uncultured Microbacterium sp.]MDC7803688.1 hypothetical protein [Sphingomonas sp. BLCC-B65]
MNGTSPYQPMIPGSRNVTGHGCRAVAYEIRPRSCGRSSVAPSESKMLPPTRTSKRRSDAANSSGSKR